MPGTPTPSHVDRSLDGVYVVLLDPDIAGDDLIAWCFANEMDAEDVAEMLNQRYADAPGDFPPAWVSYQPIAYSLRDEHLRGYLADRIGQGLRFFS